MKLLDIEHFQDDQTNQKWNVIFAPGGGGIAPKKSHKVFSEIKTLLFGKLENIFA
jgi:hypothetical protein